MEKCLVSTKACITTRLASGRGINLSAGPWYVKGYDIKNNKLIVIKDKAKISQKKLVFISF